MVQNPKLAYTIEGTILKRKALAIALDQLGLREPLRVAYLPKFEGGLNPNSRDIPAFFL